MAIRIDGTNTTANPGVTGADTDTGLQFGTNELKLVTGGSEAVTVDSSQNVGIGTSSADASLHIEKSAGSIINLGTGTSTAGSQQGLEFYGRFVNGVTPALPGQLTSYVREERQGVNAEFDLTFGTATSSDATERMRILASGGITFNGDTAAANALDDYEEGNWTPTLAGTAPGTGSFSPGANNGGFYTKIGKRVFVQFNLAGTWTVGTASGNISIGGLPFTNAASTDRPGNSTYSPVVAPYNDAFDVGSGFTLTGGLIVPNTTTMRVYAQTNTVSVTVGIGDAASTINFHASGSYEVA